MKKNFTCLGLSLPQFVNMCNFDIIKCAEYIAHVEWGSAYVCKNAALTWCRPEWYCNVCWMLQALIWRGIKMRSHVGFISRWRLQCWMLLLLMLSSMQGTKHHSIVLSAFAGCAVPWPHAGKSAAIHHAPACTIGAGLPVHIPRRPNSSCCQLSNHYTSIIKGLQLVSVAYSASMCMLWLVDLHTHNSSTQETPTPKMWCLWNIFGNFWPVWFR